MIYHVKNPCWILSLVYHDLSCQKSLLDSIMTPIAVDDSIRRVAGFRPEKSTGHTGPPAPVRCP